MISVATLSVRVHPEAEITEAEGHLLDEFPNAADGVPPDLVVRLERADAELTQALPDSVDELPLEVSDGVVRFRHAIGEAWIPESGGEVVVRRSGRSAVALELALKTAVCTRLPQVGGIPLHAAGLVIDGRAALFFGPSGAGKSTLAAEAPFPLLSDELVAVRLGESPLATRGFRGTLEAKQLETVDYPVAGFFALGKSSRYGITRLTPEETFRRMLGAVIVPPSTSLWNRVIANVRQAADSLPGFEFSRSMGEKPWNELEAFVRSQCA